MVKVLKTVLTLTWKTKINFQIFDSERENKIDRKYEFSKKTFESFFIFEKYQ